MNGVAMNLVGMMNNTSSSNKSSNVKPSKSNNKFSNMLDKSVSSEQNKSSYNRENNDLKKLDDSTSDEKVIDRKPSKANKVDKNEKPVKGKETNKLEKVTEEELVDSVEEEVISTVAEILNISEDELKELMLSLNISFTDLFENSNIKQVIESVLSITNEGDLLTNSKALEMFKQIKQSLDNILSEKNISLDDLKKEVYEINNAKQTLESDELKDGHESNENNKKVEVVDLRTDKSSEQNDNTKTNSSEEIIVEPSSNATNNSNDSKEQSNSGNGDQFESIINNVVTQKTEQVTYNGIESIEKTIYQQSGAKDVINQIVTNIKVELTDEKSTMSLQLQPHNLGKVAFSVSSQQGNITGQFIAESAAVKEAIEMNLANLKDTLEQQGIKVDEIQVIVGDTTQFFDKSQDEQQSFNQSSKNKNKKISKVFKIDGNEDIEDVVEAKENEKEIYYNEENSSVDFSA